jgi:hypothetical protein
MRSFLPRLASLFSLGLLSVAACSVESADSDDDETVEADLTSACAIGESCPESLLLLTGRSYGSVRAPANLRPDMELVGGDAGWDRVPRRFSQKTSRTLTYTGGSVVLAGNADGTGEIGVDDFFLFEVLDLQGRRLAAGTVNAAPGMVKLDGETITPLERTPGPARGWIAHPAGSVNLASILPKDQPFRLRVSAMDFAGAASATNIYASHRAGEPTPLAGRACTADAECGGGSAMCFIDRCMKVEDSSKSAYSLNGHMEAAFDAVNQLHYGYTTYRSNGASNPTFPLAVGLWDGGVTFGTTLSGMSNGSGSTAMPWAFDKRPGEAPVLAYTDFETAKDNVRFDGQAFSLPASPMRARDIAVASNAAGTRFAAALTCNARSVGECRIVFSSKPAGGTWSAQETVANVSDSTFLGIHVRKDGKADVLHASRYDFAVYRRLNPIDPWSRRSLKSSSGTNNADVVAGRGADGTTHVVYSDKRPSSQSALYYYDTTYLELGDEGIARTATIGSFGNEATQLFRDVDVDGAGNVWAQMRSGRGVFNPFAYRIDRAGNIQRRSLGTLTNAYAFDSAMAVGTDGRLALLWQDTQGSVRARRFTPIP